MSVSTNENKQNSDCPAIVLCRPQTPSNIGAVCRAMANFGFSKLYVVGAANGWRQDDGFLRLAHGYDEVIEEIIEMDELSAVCTELSSLIGFSRRSGSWRPIRGDLQASVEYAALRSSIASCGFVFGNERTGLSLSEVRQCESVFCIPTTQQHGSLNLSFAAGLVMYSFAQHQGSIQAYTDVDGYKLIETISATETKRLSKLLIDTITQKRPMRSRVQTEGYAHLQRILMRAQLSQVEMQWLERMIARLNYEISDKEG